MWLKENPYVFPGLLLVVLAMGLSSCATYYQKNLKFQEAFAEGNLEKANKLLDRNEKAAEDRNRLLYFMQKGVVLQLQGEYEKSNEYLEQAYFFIEDYKKSLGYEALALITNPSLKPYAGEDHETVLIHYYKALNYLQLHNPDAALVEARRLNNRLNVLNDRYENRKNRYSDDAFAHLLMGMAYEMGGDVNNAFIAYRNSYNAYKKIYGPEFNVAVPDQLKEDLLRTAYLNGFQPDVDFYEREFGVDYRYQKPEGGELIFFWHNGLGPVKSEWSINFTVVQGAGGVATFVNEEYGMNFAFPVPSSEGEKSGLGQLKVVRVAFPKYLSRQPVFTDAKLVVDSGQTYPLEKTENINAVARSVLEDRMWREMASSLLRLAVKQASEIATRQENQDLGAVISIINAVTEKVDTRNWQTLPYSISYARVPLERGENHVKLKTTGANGAVATRDFTFEVAPGESLFQVYHSLESLPPQ